MNFESLHCSAYATEQRGKHKHSSVVRHAAAKQQQRAKQPLGKQQQLKNGGSIVGIGEIEDGSWCIY